MSNVTRALMGFFILIGALILPTAAFAASHTVTKGESLYIISRNYGVSVDALAQANGITGTLIEVGQKLDIPESGQSYIVRSGDTLYQIGSKFGVNYQEIMSANGLESDYLYQGMDLYIPSSYGGSSEVSRGGLTTRASAWEVDLLARLITAEADAEPYVGKLAVGAVVLNRTRDANFPKSIYDVIYQYDSGTYQFEPVMNGWIERPATPDSVRAAKAALNGWDPTNGAVYFFATYVTNPWLWSRPLSGIIGTVAFTY
ncbi:Spore cortex-lytic enzyme precursor [Pelotomaculum schinkii]|uniref:Spore cortex-lytic enzyme n=1 Tax=Pelotomaculum schinkii TaxID=78350 RepID=A0A4Y7R7I5_9FIRM|nr:LysM peptidoglycan-binding domain-containing protein [Pelotomaculum schinkii]TEB04601.1 Spore cortex-lytic enzyme precursor [Pelotomaculum schinkii]